MIFNFGKSSRSGFKVQFFKVVDIGIVLSNDMENSVYLSVDGRKLAYHRQGKGPSVALIHGLPTSSYLWRNVAPLLAGQGFEVITFDLLGFGDSDKPSDFDLGLASQARLVADALRQLNWNGSAIVGHDIGGGVAQLLCVNDPAAAKRLVLVDSIAYDSFPEPEISRLKEPMWDNILGSPDFNLQKGLTKAFTRGMVHQDRVTPELIQIYERPFQGVEGRLAYLRVARALRTEELFTRMAEIEKLTLPTLILWGAEDAFQPIKYGIRLAGAMPNARLVKVDHAGHFLPEDDPALVADLIGNFIRSS